jgi:hypothetical protein
MANSSLETSQLVEHLAALPLPYDVVHACGAKAIAMAAEAHHWGGVDLSRLGTARSFIPDLSTDGLITAYKTSATMRTEPGAVPRFAERFGTGIGELYAGGESVRFGDATRITQDGESGRIWVEGADPEERWEFPAPEIGERPYNHTALLLDGSEVIDPSYEKSQALTLAEWLKCQNFPDAIIATGGIVRAATPMRIRTELLSENNADAFTATLTEHSASLGNGLERAALSLSTNPELYRRVMSQFLHLEEILAPEDRAGRPGISPHYDYSFMYEISRSLREAVLEGTGCVIETPAMLVGIVTKTTRRLAPVYAYQKWLEETQTILSDR